MKPIKLNIQAFGPFAGKEEIDFTKLGNNPLFLINGPTGAGKSSILDAICFALYGQTTGAERDATQMRCDHSDMSLLTELSLEFMLGAKRYLIRRAPTQERSKSRGEGTTTQQAEAQLWELDGSEQGRLIVSKSVGEANTEIQKLIGLGVEQFRQVMVLPQGKFRELLMADSKERETIFSQLFETHIYKKIENKLKEKAAGIRQAVENHRNEIKGILKAAEVNTEAELENELAELEPKLLEAKLLKDQAEDKQKIAQREHDQANALNKQFDDLAFKESELNKTLKQSAEIETKQTSLDQASKAQGIFHLYSTKLSETEKLVNVRNRHNKAKTALEIAREKHKEASELFEEAKSAANVLDSLKAEQTELKRFEKQNVELVLAVKDLNIKNNNAAESTKTLETKKKQREVLEKEQSENDILAASYAKDLENLIPEQHTLKGLADTLIERNKLEKVREEIQQTLRQKELAEKNVTAKSMEFDKAKKNTRLSELAWHTGQAALLAEELEEHQPCLVCGSTDHPNPAKAKQTDGIITKQALDDVRKLEDKAFEELQLSKDALAKRLNQIELLHAKKSNSEQGLGNYAGLAVKDLQHEQQAAQVRVDALAAIKLKKEILDQRILEIKKTQAESQKILSTLEAQSTNDNNDALEAKTTVDQLRKQIPENFREHGTLEKALRESQLKIDTLTQQLTKAESVFKEKQTTLDQTTSTEKALLTQLAESELLSTNANSAWEKALEQSDFKTAEQFLSAQLDDASRSSLKAEIDHYRSALDSLKGVIAQLKQTLAEKQRPDLILINGLLSQKIAEYKTADNAWREIEARSKALISVQQKLKKAHAERAALTKQYMIFGTLNDVANGATGNKVSLQRFVLSVLLDDVLIQASYRLNIMSKGRYQLVRKEDRAKGNKASGLELEVEDGDTGKPRSVATLSGGESFMAALSLALGLSDVVQSYAGGIKLDTLFIDEGFGSLDMESLDAAIKVLMDLQASGRMIGIISHVTELKEQMANRIDVVSSRIGSSIKTIAA